MSILSGIQLFSDLSSSEVENLSLFCQEKLLSRWEVLFHEWDEGNAMYILKSGSIKVSKDVDGSELILGQVNAEEVLGEMALFWESQSRMATAEALDDCELVTILSFSINELTAKHPVLLEKIQRIIEERIVDNTILENEIREI